MMFPRPLLFSTIQTNYPFSKQNAWKFENTSSQDTVVRAVVIILSVLLRHLVV